MYNETDLKESKEFKLAMEVESAINNTCFKYENFAAALRYMHPTLQQNMFRLVRELIKEQAKTDRYFDDRNIASHEMAKKLLATLNECDGLPYI